MIKNISGKITSEMASSIMSKYKDYIVESNNQYVLCFIKFLSFTITIYKSYKIVITGKEDVSALAKDFNIEIKSTKEEKNNQIINNFDIISTQIGSDEVGTGDTFGPIVVASAYVEKTQIDKLIKLGIKDSKKISDSFILKNVPKLLKEFDHCIMYIPNRDYNDLVDNLYNMNKQKAILHNKVLTKLYLKHKVDDVIVDQFCPIDKYYEYIKDEEYVLKNITFTTKGESHSIAVALASMIARYAFLIKIDELNKKYNLEIPLGSGTKASEYAKYLMDTKGIGFLENIAKLNFKNIIKE